MSEPDVGTLIREAATNGVELWMENGQLRFKTKHGQLTNVLRSALQSRKVALIAALSPPIFRKRASPRGVVRFPADRNGFWKECEASSGLRHGTHFAVKVRGTIELERIETALKRVISRHDLLRARVSVADDGVPFFQLIDDPSINASIVDLSESAAASTSLQVEIAVERAVYAPFEDGRIYRAQVIKVSDFEYLVAIVMHHYVSDAISMRIVARDLRVGLQGGWDSQIQTCERPLQYADYLLGMSEWLTGPGLEYRLALWKEKMQGAPGVRFPLTDESQGTSPGKPGALNIHLGKKLRAKLARAIAVAGVPFSLAILAANFAALANTFQRRDFFTVLLYSGRDEPALFDMVGSTISSIPVRVTIAPQMSFVDLLIQVHEAFVFAVAHRVPWGIMRPLLAEIGAGYVAPFFNYVSVAPDTTSVPPSNPRGGGFRIEPVAVRRREPTNSADWIDWKSYDLQAFDNGTEVHMALSYMSSAYQTPAVQEFANTLIRCLEALADDPAGHLPY